MTDKDRAWSRYLAAADRVVKLDTEATRASARHAWQDYMWTLMPSADVIDIEPVRVTTRAVAA